METNLSGVLYFFLGQTRLLGIEWRIAEDPATRRIKRQAKKHCGKSNKTLEEQDDQTPESQPE